ncbi:uncharacterized protein EAE98_009619 [Botrytis deweyae]|uniref:DinB-like domain-containing protein n=1 Tax=Botrytis deweyae TaxID=2478750 RepID=A0ABQ7IB54_9HELO|nr:uncharacterized protein EAE98_009619 [Botrytis deweyae]KAF7918841.1 hypothetical protein EAE98_009619 [Botrytis deweyae]
MASESKPFLLDEEISEDEKLGNRQDNANLTLRVVFLHLSLILLYTNIFLLALLRSTCPISTSIHPLPGVRIRYVPVAPPDLPSSPYAGPPSESVDQAWHDLLKDMNIRVTAEELEKRNQKSISLPEGGGHMVWIGAHHQLHCIKMLRRWNYRDHYYPNITDPTIEHWDIHADHCFDILRSAVMCQGDTTLTTFGWEKLSKPQPHVKPTEHRCVDWDALMGSLADRVVGEEEMAALVNPRLEGGA